MNRPNDQKELNEKIYEMAREELKDLKALQDEYDTGKHDEGGIEEMEGYRDPLSLDVTKEVNIMLSWGVLCRFVNTHKPQARF